MFILFLLVSCIKPYVKLSSSYDSSTTYEGLLVGSTVDIRDLVAQNNQNASPMIASVKYAILFTGLEPFSEGTHSPLIAYWKDQGFIVETDAERVQRKMSDREDAVGDVFTKFIGVWHHPETARRYDPAFALITKKQRKRVVSELNTEILNEVFIFSKIDIHERTPWLFLREPILVVNTVILDEKGEYLFRSRGVGTGDRSFLMTDFSENNLNRGFQNALESISTVEIEVQELDVDF